MHYGREGMKWGQHIYTRNDIKRLKKFISSKQAKQDAKDYRNYERNEYKQLGYKQGLLKNKVLKGSELGRYTGDIEKKLSKRSYLSFNKSMDDKEYERMAIDHNLANKGSNLYKDVYSAKRNLKVAKAKRIANDIVKRYGDEQTKDLWKLYKKMGIHDKAGYIFNMADEDYGKYASKGKATKEQIKNAEDLFQLKQQLGHNLNNMLYKDSEARNYIDNKYSKRYDMIEDAEDWSFGLAHPVIAYNGNKYLERKDRKKYLGQLVKNSK